MFLVSFEDEGVFELSDLHEEDLIFLLFFNKLVFDFPSAFLVFVDGLREVFVVFAFRLDCFFEDLYFFLVNFYLVFAGYGLFTLCTYSQG